MSLIKQGQPNLLATLSNAKRDLTNAKSFDEMVNIRDQSEAARIYLKSRNEGLELQNLAAEIRIRAERMMGECLREMPKNAGRPKKGNTMLPLKLDDLGVSKIQSSRWQQMARIPEPEFEKWVSDCNESEVEITTAACLKLSKGETHVTRNSGCEEWFTPSEYIESARLVMGSIDTDPASNIDAQKTVKAGQYFDKESNGLNQRWTGNVWMNPPYSAGLVDKFSKALCEKFGSEFEQAIVLVNNATDTKWFQHFVESCSAICFPKGRIRFVSEEGEKNTPLQGQAFLYFGQNQSAFRDEFGKYGFVVEAVS